MKRVILAAVALSIVQFASAQNVGIGTATPTGKTHIVQTAGVDALLMDHSGAAGNGIELNQTAAGNASSALWIRNYGTNRAMYGNILNAASTANVLQTDNTGLGNGIWANQTSTGASGAGLFVTQAGTGAFSRGVDVSMSATNVAIGYALFHTGLGRGIYTDLSNAANASTGFALYHSGTGRGIYTDLSNTANASTGYALFHDGTGRGGNISLSNTANTDIGWGIFHNGLTGMGLYAEAGGVGVMGLSTGTTGTGGTFWVNNTAANANSIGLFVVYDADGAAGGGGGNAAEIQQNGALGNAVDIFIGDPAVAAGPANTTNGYSCIVANHLGTGTSGVGSYKSAFNASVNGDDPSIISFSNASSTRDGVLSIANPNGTFDPRAIYGFSYTAANTDYGIGARGVGGLYGVHGWKNGTNYAWTYGVYATGDMGATGVKSFIIDHPLDPENKTLRHYAVESNEVLNVYRGTVELDGNGQAIIELPDYFEAANTNFSYHLTAIGTPNAPYVLEEISNNKFVVAGTPNTKVSWQVYGERNDPTLQYYSNDGKNYNEEVTEKPNRFKGKYYTPEAYGKPASEGINYDAEFNERLERGKTLQQSSVKPNSTLPKTKKSEREEVEESAPIKEQTEEDAAQR